MEYIGKHQPFHDYGPGSLLIDGGDKILMPHRCHVGELLSDRHYHVYVKYAYARAALENLGDLTYWQKVYSKMQLDKNRNPDFERFNKLIYDMKKFGFDSKFPIPIDRNYDILDGSHRFAISLALDIMPTVQIYSKMSKRYEKDRFKNFSTQDIKNIDSVRDELRKKYKNPALNEVFMTLWGMGLPIWDDILNFLGHENIKRAFLRSFSVEEYAAFIASMYSTDIIRDPTFLRKSWALTKFEPSAGIILLDKSYEEIRNIKDSIRNKFICKVKEYNYDSIMHTLDNPDDVNFFISELDLYKPVGNMPPIRNIKNNLDYMILNGSKSHKEYKDIIGGLDKSKSLQDLINERFDLVIFDLDGTIVNSETINASGYINLLSEFGINLTIGEALKLFSGRSKIDAEKIIFDRWGIKFLDEQTERKRLWIRKQKREMTAVPGIREFISKINCSKAIASGSSLETIDFSLNHIGLDKEFPKQNRFSTAQVRNGKPAPDIFIFISKAFGVDSDRCMVIEDSPVGINAAIDAGMHFIWFGRGNHIMDAYDSEDLKFMTKSYSKRRQAAADRIHCINNSSLTAR